MDSRDPTKPNVMLGPTSSYPHTTTTLPPPSSLMTPATARFPFSSSTMPPHPHHHHLHPHHPPPPPPSSTTEPPFSTVNLYDDGSSESKLVTPDTGKKKRGRPRKFSPDGNIALGLAPAAATTPQQHQQQVSSPPPPSSDPPSKKHRGRPPSTGKKQLDALGAGGSGFTAHVVLVEAGEDVTAKIFAFSQQGPRGICILSANGPVNSVTLQQLAVSGTTVTYEGLFEIISLSGAILHRENDGGPSKVCSMAVTLAGPDGRVLGGGVAGALTAAARVQVIVGSFISETKKSSPHNLKSGSSVASSQMLTFGVPATPTSPTSQGPSSDSDSDDGDDDDDDDGGDAAGDEDADDDNGPFNRGPGLYNNTAQQVHNLAMYHHHLWAGQSQQ